MSTQQSHALQTTGPSNKKDHNSPRKVSLDLDPYAAPNVYYGQSHGPRKASKSRTMSAVSPPQSPRSPHWPYEPQNYVKRWTMSRVSTDWELQLDQSHAPGGLGYKAPARRTSHGR